MQLFIRRALAESADFLDAVPFYEILIQSHIARNELQTAVATGKTVLRKLGIRLPRRPTVPHMVWLFVRTKLALRDRGIEDLLRLPPMRDPSMLAGIRIMVNMGTASYYSYPMLLPVLILTIMRTMLRFGNPPTAAFNYSAYGFLVCNVFGDVARGYSFARRAVAQIEKTGCRELVAKSSLLYNVFIRPLGEHVRNSLPALLAGYEAGLETGDFDYASLCVTMYHSYATYTGLDLSRLDEEARGHIETIRRTRQLRNLNTITKDRMFRLALMGRLADWRTWDFQDTAEKTYLEDFARTNDKINLFSFYLDKAVVAFLLGAYDESLRYSRCAKKHLDPGLGNFMLPEYCFNHTLTLAAFHHARPPWARWASSFTIRSHLRWFKKFASLSPTNFENKYLLMQAEWARVRGRGTRADLLYDAAIEASRRNEFINEEAMALELKARHLFLRRDEENALRHLAAAHRCYTQWGALAKTAQLETAYPRLKEIRPERKEKPPRNPDGPGWTFTPTRHTQTPGAACYDLYSGNSCLTGPVLSTPRHGREGEGRTGNVRTDTCLKFPGDHAMLSGKAAYHHAGTCVFPMGDEAWCIIWKRDLVACMASPCIRRTRRRKWIDDSGDAGGIRSFYTRKNLHIRRAFGLGRRVSPCEFRGGDRLCDNRGHQSGHLRHSEASSGFTGVHLHAAGGGRTGHLYHTHAQRRAPGGGETGDVFQQHLRSGLPDSHPL